MSISAPLAVTMMIGTWLLLADLAAHVDARDPGQHHVEQHEVGLDRVEEVEGLRAVARHLDAEALASQPDGQGLDEGLLVLDDQDVLCAVISACLGHRAGGPRPVRPGCGT